MTQASQKTVENAIKNPEKMYQTPEEVLADSALTKEEKLKILTNWRSDQNALLRAENENMPKQDETPSQPDPAAMLARIEKARRSLEEG